jgi:hypothetical protein
MTLIDPRQQFACAGRRQSIRCAISRIDNNWSRRKGKQENESNRKTFSFVPVDVPKVDEPFRESNVRSQSINLQHVTKPRKRTWHSRWPPVFCRIILTQFASPNDRYQNGNRSYTHKSRRHSVTHAIRPSY